MQITGKSFFFVLTLILALSLTALAEPAVEAPAQDDPVVVRVGDFSYPLSVVQGSLDSALDVATLLSGEEATDEDRQNGIQAVVDKFVNLGLVETKLKEAGKHDFTDDEVELMKATAQAKYEELWQSLYQRAGKSGEEVSEEDITGWLEGEGYTVEAIYAEYEVSERNHRAIEMFCQDVTLTQAMVDEYYEKQFVGPDRERYKDNVERFEEEIVSGNNEAFYIPEGYRYIRQITLDYPKAATASAKALEKRMQNAVNALAKRFQKLAVAATTAEGWDDLKDLRAEYDECSDLVAETQKAWMEKVKKEAQPLLQETFDAIAEQYAAGIDFKSLIEKYSADKTDMNLSKNGYLFHPDSTTWPDAFKEAAMKLEKPGDISQPVYSETGVHILCYVGEAPAGDHVLTEEERQQLNASAQQYYQNERLLELCAQWKDDYEVETHPELLEY